MAEAGPIRMHPIICPGREVCPGVATACRLGYEVFPVFGYDHGDLTEIGKPFGTYADYLKKSAIRALTSTELSEGGKFNMYNEADVVPAISCDNLKKVIERAPSDWEVLYFAPAADVIPSPDEVTDPTSVTWIKSKSVWGTHSLLFRDAEVVRKVVKMWKESGVPIDTTLDKSDLVRYNTSQYLMTQGDNRRRYTGEDPTDRRFLVYIQSYKRLKDAIRQTYTFLDQDYGNYIIHLDVRGISEYEWNKFFSPCFRKHVNSGKLVITVSPNRSQLENVIRYGDKINPDSYDLITKVDDDDFYGPDHLSKLNLVHASLPIDVGSYTFLFKGNVTQKVGYPIVEERKMNWVCGGNMVIPKPTMEIVKEYVKNDYDPKIISPYLGEELAEWNWKWREDNLIGKLNQKMGAVARDCLIYGDNPFLCYVSGPSVLRQNGYYSGTYEDILILESWREKRDIRVRVRGDSIGEIDERPGMLSGEVLDKRAGEYVIMLSHSDDLAVLRKMKDGKWKALL